MNCSRVIQCVLLSKGRTTIIQKSHLLLVFFCLMSLGIHSQCPGDPTFPTPDPFDQGDGGSPGCDFNDWKHEDGTLNSTNASGTCQYFIDDNDCDFIIWTEPLSTTCAFCITFDFQMPPPPADHEGFALSLVDLGYMFQVGQGPDDTNPTDLNDPDFPCDAPFDCDGSGASDPTSMGGGLGYAPTLDNTGTDGGGSLNIEYDIADGSAYGDDDLINGAFCPHVSINEDGCNDYALVSGCADGSNGMPNIADGLTHSTQICWNPTCNELTVSIDGVTITQLASDIEADYFPGPGSDVYLAFTSGYTTPYSGQQAEVCNFNIVAGPTTCEIPAGQGTASAANCARLLSLDLLSLKGEMNDKSAISLDWELSDLKSEEFFILRRSYDAIHWDNIAEIEINSLGRYTFEDTQYDPQNDVVYYQLILFGANGTKQTSQSISVGLDAVHSVVSVYPNPTNDLVYVTSTSRIESVPILMDLLGNQRAVSAIRRSAHQYVVDLSTISKGVYIVQFDGHWRRLIKK